MTKNKMKKQIAWLALIIGFIGFTVAFPPIIFAYLLGYAFYTFDKVDRSEGR